jgi:hypothetical protein
VNFIPSYADLAPFPGGDLVAKGLADLGAGVVTDEALLVSVAKPRLTGLGFDVPGLPGVPFPYEHALYEAIELRNPDGAHAEYNALIGRIVSFANAWVQVHGAA